MLVLGTNSKYIRIIKASEKSGDLPTRMMLYLYIEVFFNPHDAIF